jgi:hypothetical protein
MNRMGHASMRAAIIYQHGSHERDRAIADGVDALIRGLQEKQAHGSDDTGVTALTGT